MPTIWEYFIEVLACCIDGVYAVWFIAKFSRVKIFKNLWTWIFLTVYLSINIFTAFVAFFAPVITALNTVFMFLYALLSNPNSRWRGVVAPFLFQGSLILVNASTITIIGFIRSVEMSDVITDRGIFRLLLVLLSKTGLWIVFSLLLHFFNREQSFRMKDHFILILFPIALFGELMILFRIALAYPMEDYYGYFLAATLLLIATTVGVYYLVYRLRVMHKLQSEKELYRQMLGYEERRYTDMEGVLTQIRKIRHDMKNQLNSIAVLLEHHDEAGALEIIRTACNNINNVGNIIQSGNRVIDYTVNTKIGALENVAVVISGDVMQNMNISDVDLSIIFGNIIDNAVEAIANIDRPMIELEFYRKDYYYNIICKNSISGSVLENNPELHTTKADRENHGYGMKSIKEITAKYNGHLDVYEEDQLFCVHIMLPIR